MRAPQERTMRDLYDRTRHKDLAAHEVPAEGRDGGRAEGSGRRELVARMEDKTIVKKKLVSNDTRVKVESGTCNVCSAPCSSCLHRSFAHADSNIDCGSSQTCSARSVIKNNSLTRSEKGVRNRGENDDEFSAASSNDSYSNTGGNKMASRSSIAEDSEVDMPAKRRKLSKECLKLSKVEYLDDNNSCVTGMPAEGKHLERKKLSTCASSRDLTVKDCKDTSIASDSRLRKQHAGEYTEKNKSDDTHPSSPVMTKKLLRMQSSVSVSKGLSPKRQVHELGEAQENLSRKRCEKAFLSKNIVEQTLDGTSSPCVDDGDNNVMLTSCSGNTGNQRKAGLSPKDLGTDTSSFSKDQIQQHAVVQTNDDSKRNGVDKQDCNQDSSMDISNDGKLNIQNDVMIDCVNSEGLIDVNVCDICGDVGREYLLATCTRCLEGAEHIYCMRVKLDKVPDGEWLCEECQLKDEHSKTKCKYDVQMVNSSEGKKQSSESQNNHKALRVVVPNSDTPRINCNTPTADQYDAKKKKMHLSSTETLPRQVKVTNPAAERFEAKNKNLFSMANRKRLQVVTSDLEARSHTSGIPTPSSSNKKNQEFQLNRKKLRVSTDTESPLSSEGLRSPSISCKRLAENTSSPNPRLFTANNLKKRDTLSRENSFKKLNAGFDNAPVRNSQAVKSSQTLSRSYSMGSMVNAKAPVPSPRGLLSKQLSFNNSNNGPKVKHLVEGVVSKLRPVKHSSKDPRDQGPIKKVMKSGSFKSEGLVCKDSDSLKQKQSCHVSQDEKPVILKSMKEKNVIERRPSFNFKKPNIPSSPRPESSIKSGERKLDQDISKPGPSILKSSKKHGNVEKESSDLSTSKRESVHQKPAGFVSGKDIYAVNIPDPPVPPQYVKRDGSNNGGENSSIPVEDDGNGMPTEPPEVLPTTSAEVLPTTSDAMKLESDLQDSLSASEELASKVVMCQQKPLDSTLNSCNIVEGAQSSDDTLPDSPHGLQITHGGYPTDNKLDKPNLKKESLLDRTLNSSKILEGAQSSYDTLPDSPHGLQKTNGGYPTENKLDKPNLKKEAFLDQSTPENPSRDLVIPEQFYIWQGSFEVSRRGIPELFDGIQAYLSTCASFKVREVGKQLPQKIQLSEVPCHSSWPLQFKEVNPTEDNIALFFFAKDTESYEKAYKKLLEDMLRGDLSLTANIDGTELLIFPSDKLPERTQRWNGLLFFWGIFYARKSSSLQELPVSRTNSGPQKSVSEPVVQHDVCSPKVPQPLVIDLNQCPDDDLSDPAVPLGSEVEKTGTSIDQNKLNACEIHHEKTACTRHVSGHPTTAPCAAHFSKLPTEGSDMVKDDPSTAKDTTGIAGNSNMEEEGFCQHKTLFCVAPQAGSINSVSAEMEVKKLAFQPSVVVSPQHFSGSKVSDEPNKLIQKSGIHSSDSDSSYKRQKTSHGKHSAYSFEELPSKCLPKIHPLPAVQQNPFDDTQYIYRGQSDPASLKKPIPDNFIHVLSSDDEDSPEPSTSLNNKASLKADAGSSPLLSLSLSTVTTKHNLAGSDIGEDEPLPLSLGLPVVEGNRVLEMKQFLPEKPGINT